MSPAAPTFTPLTSAAAPRGHLLRLNTVNQSKLSSSCCKQKDIQNSLTSKRYWIIIMKWEKSWELQGSATTATLPLLLRVKVLGTFTPPPPLFLEPTIAG